jgi:hypothetical protein
MFYGTGALKTVAADLVGFRPSVVRLINVTDGSVAYWNDSMPDAAMMIEKAGTHSYVTSGGITPTASGFTLDTDAFNGNGDVIYFDAQG